MYKLLHKRSPHQCWIAAEEVLGVGGGFAFNGDAFDDEAAFAGFDEECGCF